MNELPLVKTLTKSKFGQSNPLFASATDLANQICAVSLSSGKVRKASSVATLLSNVFSGRRKCSGGLKHDIIVSVTTRLAKLSEKDRVGISNEVARAIDQHNIGVGLIGSHNKEYGLADAESLFQRLSKPNALLIVEYRDQPRATPEAKYSNFADRAGEAIAKGLHFAMIQPFCAGAYDKIGQKYYHTATVRNFLQQMVLHTREVYLAMLEAALKKCGSQKPKDIAKRLVLYERTAADSGCFVSGIQSKIFLAEIPCEGDSGKSAEREVWEWIAGKKQDFFLQRDEVSLPFEVLSEQFLHITKFWTLQKEKALPLTDAEIEETVGFWGKQLGGKLPPKLWKVFATPDEALKMVKEGFGNKPK